MCFEAHVKSVINDFSPANNNENESFKRHKPRL